MTKILNPPLRGSAAEVLIKKNPKLQATLKNLSEDTSVSPQCSAKSRGLFAKIQSLRQMFQLVVMHELANLLENNSKQLQSATLTAEQAVYSIKKLRVGMQELRSAEEFQRRWHTTIEKKEISSLSFVCLCCSFKFTFMDNKAEFSGLYYKAVDSVGIAETYTKCWHFECLFQLVLQPQKEVLASCVILSHDWGLPCLRMA